MLDVNKRQEDKKRFGKMKVIVICVIVVYVVLGIFFYKHFFPGTVIAGIKVGGKSAGQVEELLEKRADNYQLVVAERENSEEIISGKNISLAVSSDDTARKYLEKQGSGFLWPGGIFMRLRYSPSDIFTYEDLDGMIDELLCMQDEN